MLLYHGAVILHLLAMSLWIGHMLVWSLVTGPALKTIEPPETAEHLRARSLTMGGLGWPALIVLLATGGYLLDWRGLGILEAFMGAGGVALQIKLLGVLAMIVYQAVFGHRQAPLAIYANMGLALVVIACAILFQRGGL